MLPDRCPVCPILSVTLVYCGQTVKWIRMPLGTKVGLVPSNTVLDGDPAFPRKGTQKPPPSFLPTLLWQGRPSQQLLSSCIGLCSWIGVKNMRPPTSTTREVRGICCSGKNIKKCLIWSKRDREGERRSIGVLLVHSFHTYSCKN